VVETSRRKQCRRAEYICSRRRYNGIWANALRIAIEDMNEAVLQAVEEHALTPEAVEQVIALTERDELRDRRERLEAEGKDVERRIARLITVVEAGAGDVSSSARAPAARYGRRESVGRVAAFAASVRDAGSRRVAASARRSHRLHARG